MDFANPGSTYASYLFQMISMRIMIGAKSAGIVRGGRQFAKNADRSYAYGNVT
jgi:hypothetical protein